MNASGEKQRSNEWALVLGASSGFGGATAVELARRGYNVYGVHLDRAATMPMAEKVKKSIEEAGRSVVLFNINAADAQKRTETLDTIQQSLAKSGGSVQVLVHSLAFGSLKPFVSNDPAEMLTQAQMEMTLDVMANSLVYWTQGLIQRKLMKKGGRIFAMTSSGGHTVLPAYGAVSAAKAALESHIRQLAMELGPKAITCNSVMAGVTDTPALRKIPNNDSMIEISRSKNPQGRLTTPEDVAKIIALLCDEAASFVSGGMISVDGGEDIVNYVGQKVVPE